MSTPQVPPRPTRSKAAEPTTASPPAQAPSIPPRPPNKTAERSESPRSGQFARSPLNESSWHPNNNEDAGELRRKASLNAVRSSTELPPRPPSVNLPSIGQEGLEYDASSPPPEDTIPGFSGSLAGSPTHTRKVSHDLPLHAPRPSLSSSDAKQRVAAVVRTDSNGNAAANVPKGLGIIDKPLRAKSSFNRPPSSSSHERPGSSYEDDHGIPSFGQQVPLAAQYGDVQAPSPTPYGSQPHTPSTPSGFERPPSNRHHQRTKSGRNSFQAPPGSYGLHGHGNYERADDFEKAWLQKHPDVLREEIAAHSPAILERHDYQLTPEQLNKIVKASKRGGLGTLSNVSMPDEQIGYLASEAYASQNATPVPSTADGRRPQSLHVNEPEHKENKYVGRGQVSEQEHVDLGPRSGNSETEGDWTHGGVPILASDEAEPGDEYMHPAVPPISDRRRSTEGSRPSSKPGSISSPSIHKSEWEYRPLEDVREYEPLFPDDESGAKKQASPTERFKQRPDMKQRFPSKDIWEDAPASVNLEAEVETPEPERQAFGPSAFETPEQEAARKGELSEAEKAKLLPREARLAQSAFRPHIKQEMRPSIAQQRFPSRDIWEDTPDSAYITTTVNDEQEEDEEEDEATQAGAVVHTMSTMPREDATAGAPVIQPNIRDAPMIPPRPSRSKSPAKDHKATPLVPARPARRPSRSPAREETSLQNQDPNVERTKPVVPARPTKPLASATVATAVAADAAAANDKLTTDLPAAKPKPAVPARPMGGKIAALQAGFMSDLNKKLGLGPQAVPQKSEPQDEEKAEEEKKPLEDARKGRARGPARRKPAASPSGAATGAAAAAAPSAASTAAKSEPRKFFASPVTSLWDITPAGVLTSTHADQWSERMTSSGKSKENAAPVSQEVPPAVGFNAQGEAVHAPTITPEAIKATSQMESAPALQAEAEASGEAADLGHATAATITSVHPEPELSTAAAEDGTAELAKTTSAGSQTGEMNIVMGKGGDSPTTLKGYKNGSVHEEGIAFVEAEAAAPVDAGLTNKDEQ